MKNNWIKLIALFLSALLALTFTSCDNDDDEGGPEPPLVEDGWYAMGSATADASYAISVDQMVDDKDYAKSVQEGMSYGIYYLAAGDLAFRKVLGTEDVTYGVSNVADSTQTEEAGAEFAYSTGAIVADGAEKLTITDAGLYYILLDETNNDFWVMKINNFELSANGVLATYESGSAEGATFKATAVDIRTDTKVRMNTAWKILAPNSPFAGISDNPDDYAKPVISYGGSVSDLTADGSDISIENGGKLIDIIFTWDPSKKGIAGVAITTEEGDELPAAEFPEEMFMTGAALGNGEWNWDTNGISMIPVHSNAHLFWSVQWVEIGTDVGFKFCEEKAWGKDFGITGDAVDFVYDKGADNVTVTEAGYYMIVANLETEKIEINPAPSIYGIGDAFGGWDAATPASIFTVDNTNKVITSPATVADGDVRMHVAASILTNADGNAVDWWQAELSVVDGIIEYRADGGDLTAVPTTTGQVVTLDFVAGTGTIQ